MWYTFLRPKASSDLHKGEQVKNQSHRRLRELRPLRAHGLGQAGASCNWPAGPLPMQARAEHRAGHRPAPRRHQHCQCHEGRPVEASKVAAKAHQPRQQTTYSSHAQKQNTQLQCSSEIGQITPQPKKRHHAGFSAQETTCRVRGIKAPTAVCPYYRQSNKRGYYAYADHPDPDHGPIMPDVEIEGRPSGYGILSHRYIYIVLPRSLLATADACGCRIFGQT